MLRPTVRPTTTGRHRPVCGRITSAAFRPAQHSSDHRPCDRGLGNMNGTDRRRKESRKNAGMRAEPSSSSRVGPLLTPLALRGCRGFRRRVPPFRCRVLATGRTDRRSGEESRFSRNGGGMAQARGVRRESGSSVLEGNAAERRSNLTPASNSVARASRRGRTLCSSARSISVSLITAAKSS